MIKIIIEKKLNAYNGQQQLQLNTTIEKGSITKISGPSGAGKTTLLKIIAGFIMPDNGKIKYDEEVWVDTAYNVFVPVQQRHIGFAFQHYALFPNMSVIEHLRYATKDSRWINRLLEAGQLENFTHLKPEYLSGGQQQRLSILRAMATRPRLLLLDEPFSALDNNIKTKLIGDLKVLWNEFEPTVLMVTHSPDELNSLTTHSLVI